MLKDLDRLYIQTQRYVEPFIGGGSFFWHKEPSKMEVISDVNGNVTNFYRMVKSPKCLTKLVTLIDGTIHSEFSWEEARWIYFNPSGYSKVERAWAFWVLFNMSFGGMGFQGSFQITCHKNDGWIPPVGTANKKKILKECAGRLERTFVLTKSAYIVIPKFDEPDTFFYLDPPYYQANQGHYKGYTKNKFKELLDLCANMEGKFLLSSYNCEMLEKYTKENGWHTELKDKNLAVSAKGDRKVEVLTYNYELPDSNEDVFIQSKMEF